MPMKEEELTAAGRFIQTLAMQKEGSNENNVYSKWREITIAREVACGRDGRWLWAIHWATIP